MQANDQCPRHAFLFLTLDLLNRFAEPRKRNETKNTGEAKG
jgi:hypothetical protein